MLAVVIWMAWAVIGVVGVSADKKNKAIRNFNSKYLILIVFVSQKVKKIVKILLNSSENKCFFLRKEVFPL